MKRIIENELIAWKNNKARKPLILRGARQVGKTYILREFGKNFFLKFHYLNFEENPEICKIFEADFNPKRIISEISILLRQNIKMEKDLIIFDEIQFCPKAITSLKYFYEEFPESFIASAGSLLGIHFLKEISSFPVGKVEFLNMFPMNFEEFLEAVETNKLFEFYENFKPDKTYSDFIHEKLWNNLKIYFITGGMPEIVNLYKEKKELDYKLFENIRKKQKDIAIGYESDIAKYSGKINSMNIIRLMKNIPQQLSKTIDKEYKRFKFKNVIPGKKGYSSISSIIDWLINAGLVLKANIVNEAKSPLKAFSKENMFKLYPFDIGYLGILSGLDPSLIIDYSYGSYKGYFAENYILQQLYSVGIEDVFSWQRRTAEIEFLIENRGMIIPIEVKAGYKTRSKSLGVYIERYNPPLSIKFTGKKFFRNNNILNIPLYFAPKLKKITNLY